METNEMRVKIHEESDLFSPYDPDQSQLSEDVITIWNRFCTHRRRRSKEVYSIHIFTDTPVNEENVRRKIRDFFDEEKKDADHALCKLTVKAVILGLMGAAFLAIWYFLSGKENVNAEILLIIGWVGIWEATDIFIMERPEQVLTMRCLKKALTSEIVITKAGEE
jgi:hypothetical protein